MELPNSSTTKTKLFYSALLLITMNDHNKGRQRAEFEYKSLVVSLPHRLRTASSFRHRRWSPLLTNANYPKY